MDEDKYYTDLALDKEQELYFAVTVKEFEISYENRSFDLDVFVRVVGDNVELNLISIVEYNEDWEEIPFSSDADFIQWLLDSHEVEIVEAAIKLL